jgi:hypothetical protein
MHRIFTEKCSLFTMQSVLSSTATHNWVEKFFQVCSKVTDDAQPGSPVETMTEATVQWVKEFIQADMRIMTDNVATAPGCSHGLAYSIMHDCLQFQKVCTWWVPRDL